MLRISTSKETFLCVPMGEDPNFIMSELAQTCFMPPLLEWMSGDKSKNEDITRDTELCVLFHKVAHSLCEKFEVPIKFPRWKTTKFGALHIPYETHY
jgi:hypothetical protein